MKKRSDIFDFTKDNIPEFKQIKDFLKMFKAN